MSDLASLADAVSAVAPVETVRSVGGEIVIVFAPAATSEQRAAAQALVNSYVPVPQSVSPYQARIALLNAGYLSAVEALMADTETDPAAKIAWEYATVWQRDSAFIATLGPALGLTSEQVDALFVAASQVT